MRPALRDYASLWSAATASRDPRAKWAFRLVAVMFPLIVGLLVWARTGGVAEAFNYALRVPVAVWLFAALTYFVPGAVRLNTPANARLVPRMRRRLVELTILVWAAATAAALLLGWGIAAPAVIIAMATLAWLVGQGLSAAGYQVGAILQVCLLATIISARHVPAVLLGQTALAVLGLLLLALAARTLDLMFSNGGDRHWERRRAQMRAIERATPEGLLRHASSRMRFTKALYAAALRRNSAPRRAPAFVLSLLGPAMHVTQRYLPVLAVGVLAAAAVALVRQFVGESAFAGGWVIGMCQAMVFAQLFTYEQRSQRLADTRTEQSLLRMAPSISAVAGRFNRNLNASLLRIAVLDWIVVVAILLAISVFAGAPPDKVLVQLQVCCLTLPLVSANVRDHARHSGAGLLRLLAGLAGALAVSFGSAALLHLLADTPILPVAALASIVLALLAALWRWRAAVGAPHAFPVGRLA